MSCENVFTKEIPANLLHSMRQLDQVALEARQRMQDLMSGYVAAMGWDTPAHTVNFDIGPGTILVQESSQTGLQEPASEDEPVLIAE